MAATRLVFGAGYLGRRVTSAWIGKGDRVTVVTRTEASADRWRQAGAQAVVANITDRLALRAAITDLSADVETVLYSVGYDRSSGEDRRAVALGGPQNAIEAVRSETAHWVFTSSTSVYGQTDGGWVDEHSETAPPSENGQRCVEAEQLVQSLLKSRVTILRLAGLYGPDRVLAKRSTFISQTPLSGDGTEWLNLIHVDDAATACLSAAESRFSGLVLVSDEEPVRRADYYGELSRLLQVPKPAFTGQPRSLPERGGSNKRCSSQRFRDELVGSLSFPTYRQGLADAVG